MTHHPHFIELIPNHLEDVFFKFQNSEVNDKIRDLLHQDTTIELNDDYITKLSGFSIDFTYKDTTISITRRERVIFRVTLFIEKVTRDAHTAITFAKQFQQYYFNEKNIDLLCFYIGGALSKNPVNLYIFDGAKIRINVEEQYRKAQLIEPEKFGTIRLNFNNIVGLAFKGTLSNHTQYNEYTLDEGEKSIIQQLRSPKYKVDKITIHMKSNNQVKNLEIEGKEFDMDKKPFLDEQILYGAVYPYKHKGINQHLRIQERIDIENTRD